MTDPSPTTQTVTVPVEAKAAIFLELDDRGLLKDVGADLHDEIVQAVYAAALSAAPETQSEIARLRDENERLREALKPFAIYAETIARECPGWDHDQFEFGLAGGTNITMAPFRAARALTTKEG